jgi:DNA-binding transcriptional LysR family regulator
MTEAVFDPTLLTSFVTVAQAGSFTEAGRRLGLRQSTISQHIRRSNRQRGGGCLSAIPIL